MTNAKVQKWIQRVMTGVNKKFKLDVEGREVVRVKLGKKGKK